MHKLTYKAPLRDMDFLLWEQFRIQDDPRLTNGLDRTAVAASLNLAREYAEGPLAESYQETDEQEVHLKDGKVVLPESYPALMTEYQRIWQEWKQAEAETAPLPPILQNLMVEMFMAGNASFMTYVGFSQPAITLLGAHGSEAVQAAYMPALKDLSATACLCITEKQAGSDLSQLASWADKQNDGRYLMNGHKWLISAGSHEITDNIYYFVLARTDPDQRGMVGLSCFLVPRYRLDADGKPTIDNGIRIHEVVSKMGFKGCANTHMTFGEDGIETEAYLLGGKEGSGLQQLMMMMKPARISTGIFALGLASCAHETSAAYASQRVQGKKFDQSMSGKAPSLPIAEHPDVRRMRLDMAAITSGCRAIIARLGYFQSIEDSEDATAEERAKASDITEVLLPIVKAYTSDQAWQVCETAIQTFGGVGYTRHYPAQQAARDCKVLSIWEGTNHIQALFLFRDKLGMCVRPKRLMTLIDAVGAVIAEARAAGWFDREAQNLEAAIDALTGAVTAAGDLVRRQKMNDVPEFAVELQAGLGDLVLAWHLLEAAIVAKHAMRDSDDPFYQDKVDIAAQFIRRKLPSATAVLTAIADEMAEKIPAAVEEAKVA